MVDLLEDTDTEEQVGLQHEVEAEEEAAGARVEDLVENLEAEEEAAEEEEVEAVEKLQAEEGAVLGERGAKAASPAHHPPTPSLAAPVKAQVRTEERSASCIPPLTLLSEQQQRT